MGLVLSIFYTNQCETCNGTGKYPAYRECTHCRGIGELYSVRKIIKQLFVTET